MKGRNLPRTNYTKSETQNILAKKQLNEHTLHRMLILGDGRWTADGYVIITVYLHKTPVTSHPWNKVSYVMFTTDCPSPSMINLALTYFFKRK